MVAWELPSLPGNLFDLTQPIPISSEITWPGPANMADKPRLVRTGSESKLSKDVCPLLTDLL